MFTVDSDKLKVKIHKKQEQKETLDEQQINTTFELARTTQWIIENDYKHVCLQFPDELLKYASHICLKLKDDTKAQVYIIADTTYGSCCVDTISAEHVNCDAIVHYGHACLSPVNWPVLYIYLKEDLDIDKFKESLTQLNLQNIVLFYDLSFKHIEEKLTKEIYEHNTDIVIGQFVDKKDENVIHNRVLRDSKSVIKSPKDLENSIIVYVGKDGPTLFNIYVSTKAKEFYYLDFTTYKLNQYSNGAWFKRRRYIIEKCKDASTVGILVNQLSLPNVRELIQHLRQIIKKAGKKCYTVYAGKPNVAKLANFSEMDIYVLLTCPESQLFDSRDFMTPILYPFEVELALCAKDAYSTSYVINFDELVSEAHQQTLNTETNQSDVSLITGQIRNVQMENRETVPDSSDPSNALVKKDNMNIVEYEIGSALKNRTWKGLDTKIGETPVNDVQMGQSGIPMGYKSEPKIE